MDGHRRGQPFRVIPLEFGDAIIQMLMQRRLDVLHVPLGFHQGEIPFHHEVLIVQRGGIATDGQRAEQRLELPGPVQVVVLLQHRQQQAFAEAARADENQLPASLFQLGNPVGTVLIEVALLDQGGEVA